MRNVLFLLFIICTSFHLAAETQKIYELAPNPILDRIDSTGPVQFQSYGQYLFFSNGTRDLSAPHSERKAYNSHDVWRLDTKTNIAHQVVAYPSISDVSTRWYYVLNDRILYFSYAKGFVIADLSGNVLSESASLKNIDTYREPDKMSQLGSYAYFPAYNANTKKNGLWRSNGTMEGTEEVSLCAESICYGEPKRFQPTATKLFFIATSPTGTHALWTINSQHKAQMLQLVKPNIDSGQRLKPFRDGVILHTDNGIWFSDGTDAGSYAIKNLPSSVFVSEVASIDDNLVIAADNLYVAAQHGRGEAKKVEMGILIEPRNLTTLHNKIYFTATYHADGRRLNGKLMEMNGVSTPKEIYTFEFAKFFDYKILASKGNKMLILRNTNGPYVSTIATSELWVSDGTNAGTIKISDTSGVPYELWSQNAWAFINDVFYFSAYSKDSGLELWRTDGTAEGTVLSKDLAFGVPHAQIGQMVTDGRTVFRLQDHKWYKTGGGTEGNMSDIQLWKTDATSLESSFIAEWPDSQINLSKPLSITENGVYLWVYAFPGSDLMFYNKQNGSLSKVHGGVDDSCKNGRDFSPLPSIGNLFYFLAPVANDSGKKCQLWVSDGTTAGTKAISNFDTSVGQSNLISQSTPFQNELFFTLISFVSESPELTTQVFKADGTISGTTPVFKEPKDADSPATYNNSLVSSEKGLFVVTQSLQQYEQGQQKLWFWDQNKLTDLGLLTDAYGFVRFQDGIAYISGGSIYLNNGTPAGNSLLLKLPPPTSQIEGFNHLAVTPDFKHLFFSGSDEAGKIRLWRSDGSKAGTVAIGQPLTDFDFALKTQVGHDVYLSTYPEFSDTDRAEQLMRYSLNDSSAEIYTEHHTDHNNPLQVVAAQSRVFIGARLQLPSFGGPYITANLDDGDFDKDGVLNKNDVFPLHPAEFADFDGDRLGDNIDPDDDNDEAADTVDLFPKNALEWRDQDQDKTGDNADNDDDNDGVTDWLDVYPHDASRHTNQVSNPGSGTTEPTQPAKPATESSSGGAVHFWVLLCGLTVVARRRWVSQCYPQRSSISQV